MEMEMSILTPEMARDMAGRIGVSTVAATALIAMADEIKRLRELLSIIAGRDWGCGCDCCVRSAEIARRAGKGACSTCDGSGEIPSYAGYYRCPECRANRPRLLPDMPSIRLALAAMEDKLAAKHHQGYRGWDDLEDVSDADLWASLCDHAHRGAGQEIDVANFAMMLWWRSQLRARNQSGS